MNIKRASESRPLEGGASFSLTNRVERLAWRLVWTLFARWTPPPWSPWRIFLLRLFGAKAHKKSAVSRSAIIWFPRHLEIGEQSTIGPNVDCYNMAPISIGKRSVISQRAFLCAGTHDISDPDFQLVAKPIQIGDNVWIAAEAFVGPGVNIGDGAVLGARACAFSDLKDWSVYRGNPAVLVRSRSLRQR